MWPTMSFPSSCFFFPLSLSLSPPTQIVAIRVQLLLLYTPRAGEFKWDYPIPVWMSFEWNWEWLDHFHWLEMNSNDSERTSYEMAWKISCINGCYGVGNEFEINSREWEDMNNGFLMVSDNKRHSQQSIHLQWAIQQIETHKRIWIIYSEDSSQVITSEIIDASVSVLADANSCSRQ